MLKRKRCYENLSWELSEIIRFVLENYICLFETLEFRERLHAQSAQVNSYSEMPEILDLLDFALGLCQLFFGEEKGEKGAAPLTSQSRCEEGKMRVLIGLQVHGILQTQQKSQLSLLVPSLWITRLNLASLVSGCTIQHSTTLQWLTMVSNLAHPQL